MWFPRAVLVCVLMIITVLPAKAAELIMIEQVGCHWCAVWNRDVGIVYAKTKEGKRAPLRRLDLNDKIPEDLSSIRIERFTPTFILVEGNREIGRIRGYPGEDFFWGLLGQMLEKLPPQEGPQS